MPNELCDFFLLSLSVQVVLIMLCKHLTVVWWLIDISFFLTVTPNIGKADDWVLGEPPYCPFDSFKSAENIEQTQEVNGFYRKTL